MLKLHAGLSTSGGKLRCYNRLLTASHYDNNQENKKYEMIEHACTFSKQALTLDLTAVCHNRQSIHLFMHDTMGTLHCMSASNFLV